MLAYSQVDQAVRRKLEEMLGTWRKPVPGSLSTTPVFPLSATQSIVDALNRFKASTMQRQPPQYRAPSIVQAQPMQYPQTSTPQPQAPYPMPPINIQQPTPTPPPQPQTYPQVSILIVVSFQTRRKLTQYRRAHISHPHHNFRYNYHNSQRQCRDTLPFRTRV